MTGRGAGAVAAAIRRRPPGVTPIAAVSSPLVATPRRETAAIASRCRSARRRAPGVMSIPAVTSPLSTSPPRPSTAAIATRRRRRGETGQASVELVAALPLIVVVVLAAAQALAAGVARELADHAAEAGAVAMFQSADPAKAARAALPGWARDRVRVQVRDGAVAVRLAPPAALPGVAHLLEASATARATGGPS